MATDPRREAAKFYDLSPVFPDDVPFYLGRLPSPEARVLELGCGTGRVSIPLAKRCAHLLGVDLSKEMLGVCASKVRRAGLTEDDVRFVAGDVTTFEAGERFDFVIAPFRVMQHLETDAQLAGLFACVRAHLAPGGRGILNAFNPRLAPDAMRTDWVSTAEEVLWEVETDEGRVIRYDARPRIDSDRLILYPDLVYRRFVDDELAEEITMTVPMRCHYPDDLLALIESEGFEVVAKWGGYGGEAYGIGPELVVEFGNRGA